MPSIATNKFKKVVIHPTVLLDLVDHMRRVTTQDGSDRVIGALLGNAKNGIVDITNSFGDMDYAEEMLEMFHKINASENVVGWYQTGSAIKSMDVLIHERFQTMNPDVVMVQVDPHPKDQGLPAKAYRIVDETHDDGRPMSQTFQNLYIEVGAEEAEEVGVEHLLRDIGTADLRSLSQCVNESFGSLKGLSSYIEEIINYLNDIQEGKLPLKQEIFEKIQSIVYDLPLLANNDVHEALLAQNNDDASVTLLSLLIRTVISLNQLINNKIKAQISEKRNEKIQKKETKPKPALTATKDEKP